MKTKLLEYIVCPECLGCLSLEPRLKYGSEILEGALNCLSCRKSYVIKHGVPRLLVQTRSKLKEKTSEAFSYEWKHFPQLTDEYMIQFLDWVFPIGRDFFKEKIILDAGCGKGRHVFLASEFGARDVIGLDLSEGVEVAYENTKHLQNAHIVQGDIEHMPFKEPFDYVYSIGVLDHLPEPKNHFRKLVEHLKPGGRISTWVYAKEGNWWIENIVDPIRTHLTSRLPKAVTMTISFLLAVTMKAALQMINPQAASASIKRYPFYNEYLSSISRFPLKEIWCIIFDNLASPITSYVSLGEFTSWFEEAGLATISITNRNANSWRGTAVKKGY